MGLFSSQRLQKVTSLILVERGTNNGFNNTVLKISLILCPLSRTKTKGSPLGRTTQSQVLGLSYRARYWFHRAEQSLDAIRKWLLHDAPAAPAPVGVSCRVSPYCSLWSTQLGRTFLPTQAMCPAPTSTVRAS